MLGNVSPLFYWVIRWLPELSPTLSYLYIHFTFCKEIIMANSAQARKRARQNIKRRAQNASQRSMVRTYIKRVVSAIESKSYDLATEAYAKAVPVIDRMADKGIIHKNKAARHKSRLNKAIKALKA